MARDFAVNFYCSKAWRHTQREYMQASETSRGFCPPGMCERCWAAGRGAVPAEIVHHVTWLTPDNVGDPDVTLGWDNLMRVCRDCHAAIHAGDGREPRVAFDARGRVMPRGQA